MPLRILHISTRLILGGSQENTVLSCEGQARLGHEVHLAFGPIYGPEGSMLERVERFRTDDGRTITTHEVPHLVREISPFKDTSALGELRRLIQQIEPDIVHTHSSKAGVLGRMGAMQVWEKSQTGRPAIVHTIHGPPFMPIEGGAFRRFKIKKKNGVYATAERKAAKNCHVIVSVADAMTRQFLERSIGTPEQYVTVRSGMEIAPFVDAEPGQAREDMRSELGIAPGDFVIGTVARLAEHKGHDDLLDALGDDLRSRDDWKLMWVGDGWWRDRLMERVEKEGLRDNVIEVGLVPPERIPGLIRAMDVLAHPSYREGLPRTVPQALLSGVCPIAYDVDGTGEICRDGETGVLVAPGDLDALRAGVRRLHDHPDERRAMVERGREECIETFSAESMVAQLEEVYADALRRASRRA